MATVEPRRMTADIEGDFVVFLIGMRINQPLRLNLWLPVFQAMPGMLAELSARLPPQRPSRWSLVPGVPGILDHLVDRHRLVA